MTNEGKQNMCSFCYYVDCVTMSTHVIGAYISHAKIGPKHISCSLDWEHISDDFNRFIIDNVKQCLFYDYCFKRLKYISKITNFIILAAEYEQHLCQEGRCRQRFWKKEAKCSTAAYPFHSYWNKQTD